MRRACLAAVVLALAAPSLAQVPQRSGPPGQAPAGSLPPARPGPAAPAGAPAPGGPGTAPAAPKGPRELEQVKQLGRSGLVKLAPKLGGRRVEKLARDKGGVVVDRAVDLAAEQAGIVLPK